MLCHLNSCPEASLLDSVPQIGDLTGVQFNQGLVLWWEGTDYFAVAMTYEANYLWSLRYLTEWDTLHRVIVGIKTTWRVLFEKVKVTL